MFLTLFASVLAVSLSIHMTEHRRFHRWLRHPHRPHALQHKAGLGAGPCPAFGLLATGGHDVFMGPILLVCLLATAAGVPFASLAACAASLSFLSDTFCETTAGSHAPLLIPPILLYGALSPSASLLLHMVRWHVASAYMGAVLSKAALALYFNRSWVSGETLQLYLFEARFKARCGAARRMLQRFLLRRPRLLAALSVGSLAVELCIGLSPCFPRPWPVMVAGAACGLHVGIHLVMGVDFLSYWCPALLAFALPCEAPTLLDAATDALAAAPACTASALLLLAVQLFHVATLHDIRSGVDDRLPFSCFPLYALPRRRAPPPLTPAPSYKAHPTTPERPKRSERARFASCRPAQFGRRVGDDLRPVQRQPGRCGQPRSVLPPPRVHLHLRPRRHAHAARSAGCLWLRARLRAARRLHSPRASRRRVWLLRQCA